MIINLFDSNSIYNCKELIDKKIFLNQLIKLKFNIINSIKLKFNENQTQFNILNIYPHNDLGIIMSGYLSSGFLEINKHIYWITKSNIINCKINSIHINGIAVNKSESSNMLTICVTPTKNINKKKFKNGILSNKIPNNKLKLKFIFLNFSETKLLNNSFGYCANKSVKLSNILKINDLYTCDIDNYYNDDKIIIIDTDQVKGVCLII